MVVRMKWLIGSIICVAIGFALLCYWDQQIYPVAYDAVNYTKMGKEYAHLVFCTPFSEMRLYGYPLFLSLVIHCASFLGIKFSLLVFIIQTFFYLAVSAILAFVVSRNFSKRAGLFTFIGLTLNPLIYPYLAITLTDGFSVAFQIAIAAALLELFQQRHAPLLTALIGILTGYAIMVRPANIFLGILITFCIGFFIWKQYGSDLTKGMHLVLSTASGFCIAVIPQILLNAHYFHRFSFLPVCNVGRMQLMWGEQYLKHGLHMLSSETSVRLVYPNPWCDHSNLGGRWYFFHPWIGLKTVGMHVFNALNFDQLFPYAYHIHPWYQPLLFVFCQSVIFWGCVGWWDCFREWRYRRENQNERLGLFLLLFLSSVFFISWLSVYGITIMEARFGLPLISLATPIAIWSIWQKLTHMNWRDKVYPLFASYLISAWFLSQWLETLRVNY